MGLHGSHVHHFSGGGYFLYKTDSTQTYGQHILLSVFYTKIIAIKGQINTRFPVICQKHRLFTIQIKYMLEILTINTMKEHQHTNDKYKEQKYVYLACLLVYCMNWGQQTVVSIYSSVIRSCERTKKDHTKCSVFFWKGCWCKPCYCL